MSLQFIFGNSGSGKSDYLYRSVLEQADEHRDKKFLVLVPEQYTMQTQREFVQRQKDHAIMNVDVLSFARLAYRVFAELSMDNLIVLEETGKNLIMRKVAELHKEELHVLGANMNRMGYVDEVKSLISEMVQYNISPDDLEEFIERPDTGEALSLKLRDVLTLYRGYEEYMEGKYITSEEILSLLSDVAPQSRMIRDAVLIFDEFTGFTPIQNRLLRVLFPLVDKIMISVSVDVREDFYNCKGNHELFAMSKKTIAVLNKMASELHIEIEDPVILSSGEDKRYAGSPELFFLEQNLFRPSHKTWDKATSDIRIYSLKDPREELNYAAQQIAFYVREKNYRYKDFAVVTGDVASYANYVPEIFERYGIPCFIDQTRNILFHPLTEFVRAALEAIERDFSYESVFRFLRCGLFEEDIDKIDRLENYVLAKGIRGRKKWAKTWTFVNKDGVADEMPELNELRERLVTSFTPLFEVFLSPHSVKEQTVELYKFLVDLDIERKMKDRELECEAAGDGAKAKEYAQIYKIVVDLLDKAAALLSDDKITIREYSDILDAGFSAAKVGVIPTGNDSVVIGDIERTRLSRVKILFFVGVNDGVVPSNSGGGGIISQYEREKLAACDIELAPSMRERVFIQKFYLYLNMTKPSDALYISYSRVARDGKAIRPSYLISVIRSIFTELSVEEATPDQVITPENGIDFLIADLKADKREGRSSALAKWYLNDPDYNERIGRLMDAAFLKHTDEPIGKAVTSALYGTELYGSTTRIEKFAACAYAHYLTYGLRLKERELMQFASVDMGNIYHDALLYFENKIEESEYTWFDLPKECESEWVKESMEAAVLKSRNPSAFEEARNAYLLSRMENTFAKTIWALIRQVRKGRFVPTGFEVSFSHAEDLGAVNFKLSDDEKMHLTGRIDRIDTYKSDDKIYVKIIDYKSGNTTFSLLNLYCGLQLQLVVYLNAAMEMTAAKNPEKSIEPAGILYYHIDDPMVEASGAESEEEIREAVFKELIPDGLVNADKEVYTAMDTDFSGRSSVIPVAEKSDGALAATSKTVSGEDFCTISQYVNNILLDAGRRIVGGDIDVSPYKMGDKTGCDYCPYHTVCGFDTRVDGFSYREFISKGKPEEILSLIKEKTQQ
jgi:ATP-dependent helicase/nuclease subunit B